MTDKKPDPFISVQLPEEMKRYLTLRSAYIGVARSELVRQLIEKDTKRHPDTWELAQEKGTKRA